MRNKLNPTLTRGRRVALTTTAAALALALVLAPAPRSEAAPAGSTAESASTAPGYTLHEWGTFTSVFSSSGELLPGLEREEEHLPTFVYSHAGMGTQGGGLGMKGLNRPLYNVTIKMETPVIYFYADNTEPFGVEVDVGFDGGAISQWYPERTGGETPPKIVWDRAKKDFASGPIDFAQHYDGSIQWKAEVLPKDIATEADVFKPGETVTWLKPRVPDANIVRGPKGGHERYLFYRGVGNFGLPVRMTVDSADTLHIANTGGEEIPFIFVYEMDQGRRVRHKVLGPLAGGATTAVASAELGKPAMNTQKAVYRSVADGLVAAGLYRREADAMVQTWWRSYFGQPGLRVFWVAPDAFTNKILPLKVSPAPEAIERVIVGRAEVLRPSFEQKLVADFQNKDKKAWNRLSGDRYFLAYNTRVKQLVGESKKVSQVSPTR